MQKVRFVHAADLHLDASFGGIDATDEKVIGALARSTLEALSRVVDLCVDREVDFLVIAGDLHNSANRSLRAELAFQKAMQQLDSAGIAAFIVQGNHDPADGWSAGLPLPDSVTVFPAGSVERREVTRDGELVCAVYGRSYPTRQVTDNLAREYLRAPGDPLAIAVLHANVGQQEGHDNYAPCSVEDLRAAGMDYWALGHIHVAGRVSDSPPAVYPGSTQGLNPTEEGPRGCLLVELDVEKAVEEFVETASVLWRRAVVDASKIENIDDLRRTLAELSGELRSQSGGRPIVARIEITGRGNVHADLARPGVLQDLLVDIREEQLGLEPWIWIDRLRDRTRPMMDLAEILKEEGLRGDLVRLATEWGADTTGASEMVEEILAPILGQLPGTRDFGLSPQQMIQRACDLCVDRLSEDV